ncbi:hypothetical protein V7S43_004142 [Phytophthora oleae]|uniref:M96 mating-specific protein family n=1 Tax=Phytophthora oleae TaxID=2107226 RepID=A0ABD3FYA7_9STRA
MSFLIGGEDSMTLEEVVAFIDSWDTGSTSPGDVTDNDSSPFSNEDVESVLLDSLDSVLEDASFLPKKELEPKKPAKKKRKKAPGASTRLQRRKRAEILSLKAQSEQLEGRLNRLKRRSNVSLMQSGGSNSSWISWSTVAAAQYNQRLQSEMANQKLRDVLVEQMKMNNALRDAFQVQASLGNLDVIFGKGPTVQHPVADTSASMIGELEKMVEGLYLDSAAVFQRDYTPSASTLRIIQEPTRGRVFEITASTSLQCSIQEASEMLWRDLLTVRKHNDKFYHFFRHRKPSSVEKKFTWVLQSDTKAQEIDGFVFVRKIEEPNRIILVEAGRFLLPTGGLQFRIQRWTIITRSDDGPTILRTFIQIHAECAEGVSFNEKDLQDAEDLILGTLSVRLRDYLQRQQGEFAREAERIRIHAISAAH